jgi:putative peptidoglycan lipid II flippase
MAQGEEWGWRETDQPPAAPRRREAGQGNVYRSAAASGDPDGTLIMPPVYDDPDWRVAMGESPLSAAAGPPAGPIAAPPRHGYPAGPGTTYGPGRPGAYGPGSPGTVYGRRAEPEDDEEQVGSAARHSAVMAVGSLVSRGTGFLRTVVLAAALGGGLVGNAYTTAQFFPGMIYEFLLGGILGDFIVPVLARARKNDPDRGQAYTQRLLSLAVLALGTATLLAVIAAPVLTLMYASSGSSSAYHALIKSFSYLILPIIFFSGLSAVFGAVLNTRGRFGPPMWTPILNNLVVIATGGLYLLFFGAKAIKPEDMTPARIALIGGGTLLGMVMQSLGLWPALRKVGFRWKWRFDFRELGLRELGRLGGWMVCYVAISQIGLLVLLNLLNQATAGGNGAGVLIYNNVYLLMMMAHGIIAVSIITALLPRMSTAAADGRHGDVAADLSRGTRTATAVLAPIAVAYAVLAQPLMITLFERGAFNRQNALDGTPVLLLAGVALIPFAISQLFTFAFYAQTDTKTPALINMPVVLIRVVVQIAVFLWFAKSFTAAGLMIGNAVSYLVGIAFSARLLRARVGQMGLRTITVSFGKVLAAAAGAAAVGLGLLHLLPGGNDPTKIQAAIQVVAGATVIGVTYLGFAVALRLREISDVLGLVRRKLGR